MDQAIVHVHAECDRSFPCARTQGDIQRTRPLDDVEIDQVLFRTCRMHVQTDRSFQWPCVGRAVQVVNVSAGYIEDNEEDGKQEFGSHV